MNNQPDLNSLRARKARLGKKIGKNGYRVALGVTAILVASSAALLLTHSGQIACFTFAVSLISFMLAVWYHQDLSALPTGTNTFNDRLSGEILAQLKPGQAYSPQSLWHALASHWQAIFFANRLLVTPNFIEGGLSQNAADTDKVWSAALKISNDLRSKTIEPGYVVAALLLTSENLQLRFSQMKISEADILALAAWLERGLDVLSAEKPYFGGIGRDWANGFTPLLNNFGRNISLEIERYGSHYGWLTASAGVKAIKNAFSQGATAIALTGEPGVGKTSHIYALAQLLLEEKNDRNLEHRQIVALSASAILASVRRAGELERIIMRLLGETAHAGHIILFMDDAQLFFKDGTGSFNATQVLLPALQSKNIQIVMAMTPHDYQDLKSSNASFANLLTPVTLAEPSENDIMRVLEDSALSFEHRQNVLVSYEALREAYRLSGRYDQDMAYPGKAIKLLAQSLPHADHRVVDAHSVQKAIEQTRGVKATASAPAEASQLLHLEEKIHERMINQSQAVSVVANALRRSRAGVANPRRPIGSFLFLGPTGVGKTELAKAIAATYFGSESNMIRLDMSEYQQEADVNRLLSNGQNEKSSLIMAVRQQPFSVVLLDEIEKAHPNILNLLLQLLDEGQLTDIGGRPASFKDCIIITTSNAGAQQIRERIEKGESLESFEAEFTDELINSSQFKPELLNRFDEIVLFRPLNQEELGQVVGLMIKEINKTLANQNISIELTAAATAKIVHTGYDARLGARPMRRALQRAVEDNVANKILAGQIQPGSHVTLDEKDLTI